MKKYITIIAAMLLSVSLFAQDHFSFRDIPITGSIKSVYTKLAAKGYDPQGELDTGIMWLKGKFAGQDATILVVGTTKTETAWKVRVVFEETKSWSSARDDYDELKENLQAKYGKPTSYEYFKSPYELGDGYETTAFYSGKATWVSFFDAYNDMAKQIGSVTLRIEKFGSGVAIVLDYEDLPGSEIWEAEKKSVISNDL